MSCPDYQPKQSDLVLIGAAESVWKNTGLQITSEAQVLATPAMVQLDWQRSVLVPQALPCIRTSIAKQLTAAERLVSFGRLALPQVATYSRAYRALVTVQGATTTVQVIVDLMVLGTGRTELTLVTTAPAVAAAGITAAEIRLGRLLVARARG